LEPEGSVLEVEILWQGDTIRGKMRYLDLIKFVASMDPEDIYPGKTGYKLISLCDSQIVLIRETMGFGANMSAREIVNTLHDAIKKDVHTSRIHLFLSKSERKLVKDEVIEYHTDDFMMPFEEDNEDDNPLDLFDCNFIMPVITPREFMPFIGLQLLNIESEHIPGHANMKQNTNMEHLLHQKPIEYIVSEAILENHDLENGIHEHCFHVLGGGIKYRAFRDGVGYWPHNAWPDNIKYRDEYEMPIPPLPECIQGIQDAVSLYFSQNSLVNVLNHHKDPLENRNFLYVLHNYMRSNPNLGINQKNFLILCNKFCDIETRAHLEKASLFAKVHLANN
jgi:hypothetical protein